MSKSYQHEIRQHFDVIMIVETILHMFQKLVDINAIKTGVEKRIHAFKCCLQHSSQILPTFTTITLKYIQSVSQKLQKHHLMMQRNIYHFKKMFIFLDVDSCVYIHLYQQYYFTTDVDYITIIVKNYYYSVMLVLVLKDSLRTKLQSLSWSLSLTMQSLSLLLKSLSWSLNKSPWSCPCFQFYLKVNLLKRHVHGAS